MCLLQQVCEEIGNVTVMTDASIVCRNVYRDANGF